MHDDADEVTFSPPSLDPHPARQSVRHLQVVVAYRVSRVEESVKGRHDESAAFAFECMQRKSSVPVEIPFVALVGWEEWRCPGATSVEIRSLFESDESSEFAPTAGEVLPRITVQQRRERP
jgi:hypothetical protein